MIYSNTGITNTFVTNELFVEKSLFFEYRARTVWDGMGNTTTEHDGFEKIRIEIYIYTYIYNIYTNVLYETNDVSNTQFSPDTIVCKIRKKQKITVYEDRLSVVRPLASERARGDERTISESLSPRPRICVFDIIQIPSCPPNTRHSESHALSNRVKYRSYEKQKNTKNYFRLHVMTALVV